MIKTDMGIREQLSKDYSHVSRIKSNNITTLSNSKAALVEKNLN